MGTTLALVAALILFGAGVLLAGIAVLHRDRAVRTRAQALLLLILTGRTPPS